MAFIAILKESIKLLGKNGKLMASVTALSMISYTIFFFIFIPSSNIPFVIYDILPKESMLPVLTTVINKFISDTTGITSNNLPLPFLPLYFIITFISMITTVTVSSHSCNGDHSLSLKELSSSIKKSWTRPLGTGFYTTILVVGYDSLVVYTAVPLIISSILPSASLSTRVAVAVYFVAAGVLYLYASGFWIMSLVVSVVDEDGGGVGGVGKSAEMVEGRKLDVFLLNVLFNVAVVLVGGIVTMETRSEKIWGLLMVNFCCLIRVFTFVAYTVLYFRGREGYCYGTVGVELQGSDVESISNNFLINSL